MILIEKVEEIASLLHRYLKEEISPEERVRLDAWVNQSAANRSLFLEVSNKAAISSEVKDYYHLLQQIEAIRKRHTDNRARVIDMFSKKTVWPRYVAAASVILFITIGAYFYFGKEQPRQVATTSATTPAAAKDILPAGDKAVLTLANGSQIELNTADNGVIAREGKTTINKNQDGRLEYNSSTTDNAALAYNMVTTPRGGKYQLVLPDGSKVWLNAASSLRFPVAFTGSERRVELTGEAYFEIASSVMKSTEGQKKRPFIVSVNGSEVEVLGTHFNINAYREELTMRTTLLEGSVKVTPSGSKGATILQPGQQAIISSAENELNVIDKENPGMAIAWIRGKFAFESTSFKSLMQDLSRWYDVQIEYEGDIPTKTITGEVDRTIPLSELLSMLEQMADFRFKIEGRSVKVSAR
ncbi:hypothetical protein A4R26_12395 [Niastella populi]|uniref:Iron dicitrate transport regulator FecR n=1 Tax=Niastella populi TaxID=550983 RepID=A0A1V9GAZ0_9BACT|nr:hypothetical protein A4R26_12395 [Niastella populi]